MADVVAALIVRRDTPALRPERRNKANSRGFPHFLTIHPHPEPGGKGARVEGPFVTMGARLRRAPIGSGCGDSVGRG